MQQEHHVSSRGHQTETHSVPLSMHVPQRQPKRPLTIWTPHKITSRQLVASRVAKSPMWNGTMLSGAKHISLKISSDRYLPSPFAKGAIHPRAVRQ